MTVITKEKMDSIIELKDLIPGWTMMTMERRVYILMHQPAFMAVMSTGRGFYRANFGPAEFQSNDLLESLEIAFLKDKGYEVID